MKAVFHDDDAWLVQAIFVPQNSCDLQGTLYGFSSRICHENTVHSGDVGQAVRQFLLPGYPGQIGRVHECAGLFTDNTGHFRVGMAQRADTQTTDCIEVSFSVVIPKPGALSALERNR